MFYLNKTPSLLKRLFPSFIWEKQNHKSNVFLTFDDGPTVEYTQQILDLLKTHGVLATFFCVGANVKKHSKLYKAILDDGHSVGNHTMHHLNGWKTSSKTYLASIKDFSGSVDVLYDEADTNGQTALAVGSSVTLNFAPEGSSSGDVKLTGTAIVTGKSITSSFDGLVESTITVQGTGGLTTTTY